MTNSHALLTELKGCWGLSASASSFLFSYPDKSLDGQIWEGEMCACVKLIVAIMPVRTSISVMC